MFDDEGGVDWSADMICQRRIGFGFLERVECSVLDITQPGCEALADQGKERKHMVAGTAGVGEQFLDIEDRIMIEQTVEYIDSLAFCRADRQDAVVTVLAGKPALEFRAGRTAIMEIDVAALGGPVAGAEELPVG